MTPPARLPPPPSLFGKLPVELLKHIVALVREQDKAFRESEVESPGSPCYVSDSEDSVDEDEDVWVAGGQWSRWYGHGVEALSLANKQMRAVALPFLFKATTPAHLHNLSFKAGDISDHICSLIDTLDFAHYTDDHLPTFISNPKQDYNYEWRRFAGDSTERSKKKEVAGMRKKTRTTFLAFAKRVSRIELEGASTTSVVQLLDNFATPGSLRELVLNKTFGLFSVQCRNVVRALEPFSLETLAVEDGEFADNGTIIHKSWKESFRLPTLTSLTFRLTRNPSDALLLIEAAAPNLTQLELKHEGHMTSLPANGNPAPSLRRLTHLTITGHLCITALLPLFATSPLLVVSLNFIRTCSDNVQLSSIIPASLLLPPSFRLISVKLATLNRPPDTEILRSHLARRGIAFELAWTPEEGLSTGGNVATETLTSAEAGPYHEKELNLAIKDTLEWTARRVDWLEATGDKKGIEELGEALKWVRQRQLVDGQ